MYKTTVINDTTNTNETAELTPEQVSAILEKIHNNPGTVAGEAVYLAGNHEDQPAS